MNTKQKEATIKKIRVIKSTIQELQERVEAIESNE